MKLIDCHALILIASLITRCAIVHLCVSVYRGDSRARGIRNVRHVHVICEKKENQTDQVLPFQTIYRILCWKMVEEGFAIERPVGDIISIIVHSCARMLCDQKSMMGLTVGALDCLMEYVRCILMGVLV